MPIDYYKLAPTFLYHKDHSPQLFTTQEAVDRAWQEGWYGPPWLVDNSKTKLISERANAGEFTTKAQLLEAIHTDPRYEGITANKNMNMADLTAVVMAKEEEILSGDAEGGDPDDGADAEGDDEHTKTKTDDEE